MVSIGMTLLVIGGFMAAMMWYATFIQQDVGYSLMDAKQWELDTKNNAATLLAIFFFGPFFMLLGAGLGLRERRADNACRMCRSVIVPKGVFFCPVCVSSIAQYAETHKDVTKEQIKEIAESGQLGVLMRKE